MKVGDKIKIIKVDDSEGYDYQATLLNGKEGIIEHIDSLGQLHGSWGGLAIIPGVDDFILI